jgi:hypothetical protein
MPGAGDEAAGRRCTATTLAGQRCQNWALDHMEPPRCRVHAYPDAHGRLRHGFYRHPARLPPEMQASLARMATNGEPLAAEIAIARLKVASLLATLRQPDLPPSEWLAATRLLLLALRTTGRLARQQHSLKQAQENAHGR